MMMANSSAQRGVALVVALILLVVITLLGLAAIRATTVQQQITANFYDRELAFQSAEAALVAGAAALNNGSAMIARNCAPTGGTACEVNPFTDPGFDGTGVQTVASSQFDAGSTASAQPQYVIENMGSFPDTSSSTGFNQTANAAQYGAQGVSGIQHIYYRITARSGDPTVVGQRAVVILQALYKQ